MSILPRNRPDWTFINLCIVWIISLLSTCTRLHVGGLLWNPKTKQIVAIGYNGSPRGAPHCLDAGCEMEDGHCVRCLHCEQNLLYWAGLASQGCWMYLNYSPCRRCCNLIAQGGIKKVTYTIPYGNTGPVHEYLLSSGIQVECYNIRMLSQYLLKFVQEWCKL